MFKKAERKQVKFKMALTGPSGAGKTYSALLIAKGLAGGGKIALVDTENRSASLYAGKEDVPEFDVLEIEPPFEIDKYRQAIQAAVKSGYAVLVVDSITHAWAGEGGLLDKKEALDRTGKGNSYTNWASISKEHEKFKSDILQTDIHMVCTMRSKQDYALVENERGKSAVQKMGMAPIQRDGMEYEFTTVLDLSMSHEAMVSKDRTGLFDGKVFKPTATTGKKILDWLNSGAQPEGEAQPWSGKTDEKKSDMEDYKGFVAQCKKRDWPTNEVLQFMHMAYQTSRYSELTPSQRSEFVEIINTFPSAIAIERIKTVKHTEMLNGR